MLWLYKQRKKYLQNYIKKKGFINCITCESCGGEVMLNWFFKTSLFRRSYARFLHGHLARIKEKITLYQEYKVALECKLYELQNNQLPILRQKASQQKVVVLHSDTPDDQSRFMSAQDDQDELEGRIVCMEVEMRKLRSTSNHIEMAMSLLQQKSDE